MRHPLIWMALLLCLPTLIPIGAALLSFIGGDADTEAHLREVVLPQVIPTTLWLMLGVGVLAALIGTSLAALVALTDFPGRRFFSWALLLPLALPGYVLAVAFIGLLDYSGALAGSLRGFGIQLPEIRSLGGLCLVMALALYPYVYLLAREAFVSQGLRALELARSLGDGPARAFLRSALPMARPWIAGGTLLVMMETLADFGTVSAFNIDTLSSAIYKAWFALFSVQSALQIAGVLLFFVLVLVWAEKRSRRAQRFASADGAPPRRIVLRGVTAWTATGLCACVLLIAFAVPVGRLLMQAMPHLTALDARWWGFAGHSLMLAGAAALLCTAFALVFSLARSRHPGRFSALAETIGTAGYGLPGALLAVGFFVPVVLGLQTMFEALRWDITWQPGLALLMLAYAVRFTAVAHAPLSAGLQRIRPSWLESARLSGLRGVEWLGDFYAPLLRRGLWLALLLVFVDVMKEMPITLMMRPFGWDTLATRVFELSNEGLWAEAALPSLAIVLVGLLPILLLEKGSRHGT